MRRQKDFNELHEKIYFVYKNCRAVNFGCRAIFMFVCGPRFLHRGKA